MLRPKCSTRSRLRLTALPMRGLLHKASQANAKRIPSFLKQCIRVTLSRGHGPLRSPLVSVPIKAAETNSNHETEPHRNHRAHTDACLSAVPSEPLGRCDGAEERFSYKRWSPRLCPQLKCSMSDTDAFETLMAR